MENLGRCGVTKGAQDVWAGTGFACPLPGARGWRVGARIEATADSKPLLTLVFSTLYFNCSLVCNLSVSWHLEFWLTPLPGVPAGLPQHLCGPLCESCWAGLHYLGNPRSVP